MGFGFLRRGVSNTGRVEADNAKPGDAVVDLRQVTKRFDNGTRALAPVDLTVSAGDFVSLLGPSGCGKSTVLRIVAGLTEPSSGDVSVLGQSPAAARGAGRVAFVFQDPTLLPWLCVAENAALPLELAGGAKAHIGKEVSRALDVVGLGEHRSNLPHQLSGGMRMRVSIARALVVRPKLLLLDEPFAALDEITRQHLQDELLSIVKSDPSLAVIFVTHNLFEAAYLSSRIAVLAARPGRVIAEIEGGADRGTQDFRSSKAFADIVARSSVALRGELTAEMVA